MLSRLVGRTAELSPCPKHPAAGSKCTSDLDGDRAQWQLSRPTRNSLIRPREQLLFAGSRMDQAGQKHSAAARRLTARGGRWSSRSAGGQGNNWSVRYREAWISCASPKCRPGRCLHGIATLPLCSCRRRGNRLPAIRRGVGTGNCRPTAQYGAPAETAASAFPTVDPESSPVIAEGICQLADDGFGANLETAGLTGAAAFPPAHFLTRLSRLYIEPVAERRPCPYPSQTKNEEPACGASQ